MPRFRVLMPAPSLLGPLLLLTGCATRDVPTRYPESSAASLQAPAAPALATTQALEEDPPLPGSQEPGWRGLSDPRETASDAGAVDPHAHHRGHHAH